MEEKNLTLEQENVIKEKAKKLKTEGKYRKVFPMVVFGDTESGEKEFYVAYMREPNFRHSPSLWPHPRRTRYKP